MDTDIEVNRTRHQMAVPGLGVFIAPNAVARLFVLHDYKKCPKFTSQLTLLTDPCVLYPILRPNVYYSPRMFCLTQTKRILKNV